MEDDSTGLGVFRTGERKVAEHGIFHPVRTFNHFVFVLDTNGVYFRFVLVCFGLFCLFCSVFLFLLLYKLEATH